MDTRLTIGSPYPPVLPHRAEPVPVAGAVKTDLPIPAAVSAQVGAEQARWHKDPHADTPGMTTPRPPENTIEVDRDTGDLVYKLIDPATKATIVQYPYEAILRLKAYLQAQEKIQSAK